MHEFLRITGFVMLFSMAAGAGAEDVSREAIKGLDEQVQDIKQDVLSISTELMQLEEKLIYPSNTQVSVFVSLPPAPEKKKDRDKKSFRLDSVEISLDGKPATHHLYTQKELEALSEGGMQRLYTGNIRSGEHLLEVTVIGKTAGNDEYRETAKYPFTKEVGPRLVEMTLAGPGAELPPISFLSQ